MDVHYIDGHEEATSLDDSLCLSLVLSITRHIIITTETVAIVPVRAGHKVAIWVGFTVDSTDVGATSRGNPR